MTKHNNEKPIRIVPNEKILNFSKKISRGIEGALNFILNAEDNASITAFEPFLMPINAYIQAYKKKSILIKMHAEQAFTGELYWFFELNTAIALGGQMRLMPTPAIDEKLKLQSFDTQDQDSFGEVGNQLCGILDRIFREMTSKKIHLRMDFNKKVYPDEIIDINSFLDKEEYAVLLGSIKLPKYGEQKLTLLLPRTLYETMLGLEVKLEGITPKVVALYTENADLKEEMSKVLNTRYSKLMLLNSPDEVLSILETPELCCTWVDLPAVTFPLAMNDNIFFKRIAANRLLPKQNFALSYANSNDENIKVLLGLGIKGATTMQPNVDFIRWSQAYIKAAQETDKLASAQAAKENTKKI